ncbi:DUF2306 domain-containing protein [Sphingomonas sp. CCH10-B3]|uniref:DUF2306 domain-containing protein n=1 Tax=Sphingomonas sp. CCH10-B3 TaxID=1768757 RepID=UPI00083475A7|nr:DUF2306 domain-containing protein [Sphingomonas sp. CCH10-B3]
MGSTTASARATRPAPPPSLAADLFERLLALGAVMLLGFVLAAILRGYPSWPRVPIVLWVHLATMTLALALTPVMLLRRRGDRPHRLLGTLWVAAMIATALDSLLIRNANHGGFSIIHILSAWVLIQAPLIWWSARTHKIKQHRRSVRAMVFGALLIAGFFTFPFNRLLGQWLFG